ncbi:MAG: YggS family pyridoxal phosphate-dependent enzyme [Rhodospirillales bacterium]
MTDTVQSRLAAVHAAIGEAACEAAGADSAAVVRLIAVSKTFSAEAIEPLLAAGHRDFGENRAAEAEQKWPPLKARWPGVRLSLIGPLQTNKARQAVRLFDEIQTLDRPRLAHTLARLAEEESLRPDLFVQVNTGEEEQKAGVAPHETDALVALARDELGLPVVGLMCIPPLGEPPAPHFALLAKIAARNGLARLSMGMSSDYETAVRFGATDVRVGSAIFGPREAV